ncbi:MAG: ribosome-associated translation inhibitor RaiA [Oscillospiraceae bacterium]|jgi:putative sigma-54 modulation protein|nr:ribosome-associated translation inhibitor RaiA [Oscillospiraceae bacterium]
MNITITSRKVNLRDSFKERVEHKLAKFNKFFGEDTDASVTVSLERNRQTVEVTIKHGGYIYRSEHTDFEMETALDRVVENLSRQIRKNKTRIEKKLKSADFSALVSESTEEDTEETSFNVVRSKHFAVKPMDVEEAILQMNLLGHQFYMFRNIKNNDVSVVYRRNDGDYGLLEADEE